jgi:hypothetical protein
MATEKRRASARASKRGQGSKDNAKLFKARLQPRCKRVSSCLLTLRAIEKHKPGRLALFGRPRFAALVSVAFHPLV